MIAIYAGRANTEARECRKQLLYDGIPCALIGPEYGHADLAMRLPFLTVTEDARDIAESFICSISADKILRFPPDIPAPIAFRQAYLRRFGTDMDTAHIRDVRFIAGEVLYRGNPVHLTPVEMRILRLLLFCRGEYFHSDEIAALCTEQECAKTAAVHVCAINEKTRRISCQKIIETRRYKGYRIQ